MTMTYTGSRRLVAPQRERVAPIELAPWHLGLLVFFAELAFGMWLNTRGFVPIDAFSRSTSALAILHSADPHLSAVGFVWMPLPTLLQLPVVAFFPWWDQIVASGFSGTFVTALASGATAAVLYSTARAFDVPRWVGVVFTLLVAFNPMVFFYGSNGLSDAFATLFLTGAVAYLTRFWHTGLRRYVTVSGLCLALGFASVYEAAAFGAALFVALIIGIVFGRGEARASMPQGPLKAVIALGMVLLLPSIYVAALWIGSNAVLMNDPLFFAHGVYSNYAQTAAVGNVGPARLVAGDLLGAVTYAWTRTWPFLVPCGALLLLRAVERRLWRPNTFVLVFLSVSVPFGLILPLLYLNTSSGYLRYFMYPLFAAAGWSMFEIARSRRRWLANALVLGGWLIALPATLSVMMTPERGREEYAVLDALWTGKVAAQTEFPNWLGRMAPVARYLETNVLDGTSRVAVDTFQGSAIVAQLSPTALKHTTITSDQHFEDAVRRPEQYNVRYLLVPSPAKVPQDAITRIYPRLWEGAEPGWTLLRSFEGTYVDWRLYQHTP